jgi:Prophage CP4-57 regulatory protein (AlpA)
MLPQATGRKSPGQNDPAPGQLIVDYNFLKAKGVFTNRVDAARKRAAGFPTPIELSPNRIGWFWHEVEAWLAARPRRAPKTGAREKASPEQEARDPA